MPVTEWNAAQVEARLRSALATGLTAGAIQLERTMRDNMGSEGGGPIRKQAYRIKNGRRVRSSRNVYVASPPFNFPGVRTGNLKRSIAHSEASETNLVAGAGVSLGASVQNQMEEGLPVDVYALWLEFGTTKMAPRPWAWRSFYEDYQNIRAVVLTTTRRKFKRDIPTARLPIILGSAPKPPPPKVGA